jgi:hypothetical protein
MNLFNRGKQYRQVRLPIELRDILNEIAALQGRKAYAAFNLLLNEFYFSDSLLGGLTEHNVQELSRYLISYNGELTAISIELPTYELLEQCAATMRSEFPQYRGTTIRSVRLSNLAWALIMQKCPENEAVKKLLQSEKKE